MIRAYFRCNGGDYFSGESSCPFDGWSSPEVSEFVLASRELQQNNETPSIDAFRRLGVSNEALKRIVIIEFGNDQSGFDALSPGTYLKDGVERKLGNLGPDLT